eukprot:scaffold13283_cov71-Skeletonema_marinoi.AAC.9
MAAVGATISYKIAIAIGTFLQFDFINFCDAAGGAPCLIIFAHFVNRSTVVPQDTAEFNI